MPQRLAMAFSCSFASMTSTWSWRRARALVDRFAEEPHLNPSTGTMEFSVRDPDGYYVTISALSAG
jgi:hypothetical protein